jgi:CMP-N,N'-diacetyllegionaminic acid synthase
LIKNSQKVICIIPARGGSKGIKNKNLMKVNKKPLIFYPINAAIKSKVCDYIFVSTDSSKIAKVAKAYNASVPFLRKKKYSQDLTTTEETLKNALLEVESYLNIKFDICVFLTCTNIFRKIEWIKQAVEILKKDKKIDSAFSVHSLYKHFWHYKNKELCKVLPWMKNYTSRQIAPKLYREDTGLACATRAKFWRVGKRIGKKVELIVNDDPYTSIDIHSKADLKIADFLVRELKNNKEFKE